VLVITACSPKVRFTRLVTKHPELLTQDSVVLIDTFRVVVPEVKVDTVVKLNSLLDTVYLQQEQLKVKVWMKGDQVFIEGKCDTVYVDKIIERNVPIRYYKKTEKFIEKIKLAVMGIGITVFLLLIIYALYRILNRS
jgi:hypothetical protein